MVHGLWMYPTGVALAWHHRTGRPFVVNPHGMLDPWAVNHSYWKKRLVSLFHESSSLRKAACLRALCGSEAGSMRAYGLRNPICVIPNGIDLPAESVITPAPWEGSVAPGRQALLYLGRIHPKKGLSRLLRAWALLRKWRFVLMEDWDLIIAGWSQNGHEQELKNLARQLGVAASVCFPGPQFGRAKTAAYHHADAFVLPSLSEGLPMAVLEAWAHQLPVVMTPQCHLPEGFEAGAALCAEPETASIVQTLEALFSMDHAARARMGRRGRQLAAGRFNWFKIGVQMHEVCHWLLGEAGPPGCLLTGKREISAHEPALV